MASVLLAKVFVPNPDPARKTIVHHMDGNQLNDSVDNLEWVDEFEHAQRHIALRNAAKLSNSNSNSCFGGGGGGGGGGGCGENVPVPNLRASSAWRNGHATNCPDKPNWTFDGKRCPIPSHAWYQCDDSKLDPRPKPSQVSNGPTYPRPSSLWRTSK